MYSPIRHDCLVDFAELDPEKAIKVVETTMTCYLSSHETSCPGEYTALPCR